MTIDSTVPYIGRSVAVHPESGTLNNVTYTLRGSVTVTSASSSPGTMDNRASVVWSLGTVTVVSESTVPNSPGTYDYSLVFTTPATGSLSEIDLYFSQGSDGTTSSWGKLMLIPGNTPTYSYFDGYSSPDTDLTASWTGIANQSSAKLSGVVPKSISSSNCAAIQSTKWAANGTISARLIPTSVASSTSMVIASTASGSMAQIAEGVTYTLLATRHLNAPLAGSLSNYVGKAALVTANMGAFYSDQTLPNTAGEAELRWTFTVPVGAGLSTLRLGHGGSLSSGDVYWDQVLILQQDSDSPYAGGYFDGGTPDTDLANYEWSGNANDSTSIIRGVGSLEPIVISYQPAYI